MGFLGVCSLDIDFIFEDKKYLGGENIIGIDILYYLVLGDSYMIGVVVLLQGWFLVQFVDCLNVVYQDFVFIKSLDIIVKSGWIFLDLLDVVEQVEVFNWLYDFVILFIGVNNQY